MDAGNDIYYDVTQASAAKPVVSDLLSLQPETLAAADMSNFLGKRRIECRKNNPQFSLSLGQKFIGSTKYVLRSLSPSSSLITNYPVYSAAFVLKVFGGVVEDLHAFLGEERLPEGWEPRTRHRMGLTMSEINMKIAHIELGVKEEVDGTMAAPRGPLVAAKKDD